MTRQTQDPASTPSNSPIRTTVRVIGMTCGHCTAAVRATLSQLPVVIDVDVQRADGAVTIRSNVALDPSSIGDAFAAAGYGMTP